MHNSDKAIEMSCIPGVTVCYLSGKGAYIYHIVLGLENGTCCVVGGGFAKQGFLPFFGRTLLHVRSTAHNLPSSGRQRTPRTRVGTHSCADFVGNGGRAHGVPADVTVPHADYRIVPITMRRHV